MDVLQHNRESWNLQSKNRERWSQPVSSETISAARQGKWSVILTPTKAVPRHWFGEIRDAELLALASGGGQQVPILASAGAKVTSFDNSDEQLERDREVATREGLSIETLRGDMADLSCFPDATFHIVFHPTSNVFCERIQPVWEECFRVLKPGGRLIAGFMNPSFFLFDHASIEKGGPLEVSYRLPYSDTGSLPKEQLDALKKDKVAFEFGHSLTDQIGGQLRAGFLLADLYEDSWDDHSTPLNEYFPIYISTLSLKPQ